MACDMSDIRKLQYDIHKYSSFSTSYLPEHIREDCPHNQTSRWSSNTNSPPQFLMLKLQRLSVVKRIKFGKYEKTHVCNLRKFRIYGGIEEDHMVLLLESGLRNDSVPETFNLRCTIETGELLPVMFIKIMPLLSWGPSFNFSIWYVELQGTDDPLFIKTSLYNYNMLREVEIVRLCLKHFRQQGYDAAFKALQEQTQVDLEHEMMSNLHDCLINRGDFRKTEDFVEKCVHQGLMDGYLLKQDYKASWVLQDTINSNCRPGMRGGHHLVIDTVNSMMYLFGGWDGFQDLSDLWCYDIAKNAWTLIHDHTEKHDGPSPRSCHKMVYDPYSEQIFALGRYLDISFRTKEHTKSDFYLLDTTTKTWLQICDDTSQVGGPQLIFDHQMCIDVAHRKIYVFGGRILTALNIDEISSDPQYSGLFSYHIDTNTWTQILVDCSHPSASIPGVNSIKSRVTHTMLFHNKYRKLYIFGGQRNKEYTTEFISYDVDNNTTQLLNGDHHSQESRNVPQAGFTQRTTIDCERDEIYVLTSLSKEKERRGLNINSFWVFSLRTNEWTCIYRSDHSNENCLRAPNTTTMCSEPCPRYAHQLVYDSTNRVHYLFGGNPGRNTTPDIRLDDLWVLYLNKPSRQQILRHCKYLIRRLEYEEITKQDPFRAIEYLQTSLSDIIDHDDPDQLDEFHKLASLLFKNDDQQITEQTRLMTVPLCGLRTGSMAGDSAGAVSGVLNSFYGGLADNLSDQIMETSSSSSSASSINCGTSTGLMSDASTNTENICAAGKNCLGLLAEQCISKGNSKHSLLTSNGPTVASTSSSTKQKPLVMKRNLLHENDDTTMSYDDATKITVYNINQNKTNRKLVDDQLYIRKNRRCLLFNKLVNLMPESMVQPNENLSDFVLK